MNKHEGIFLFSFVIILAITTISVVITFNPIDVAEEMGKRMGDSSYAAQLELERDSSLIATCHMEFWGNQSRGIYTDASGIHKGSSEGGTLNYVCYYRNDSVIPTNIGYFNSHDDAFKFVFMRYNNYFNGNNGWVYNIEK